jgi:hypothetical protein
MAEYSAREFRTRNPLAGSCSEVTSQRFAGDVRRPLRDQRITRISFVAQPGAGTASARVSSASRSATKSGLSLGAGVHWAPSDPVCIAEPVEVGGIDLRDERAGRPSLGLTFRRRLRLLRSLTGTQRARTILAASVMPSSHGTSASSPCSRWKILASFRHQVGHRAGVVVEDERIVLHHLGQRFQPDPKSPYLGRRKLLDFAAESDTALTIRADRMADRSKAVIEESLWEQALVTSSVRHVLWRCPAPAFAQGGRCGTVSSSMSHRDRTAYLR